MSVSFMSSLGSFRAKLESGAIKDGFASKLEAWGWIIAATQSEDAEKAREIVADCIMAQADVESKESGVAKLEPAPGIWPKSGIHLHGIFSGPRNPKQTV